MRESTVDGILVALPHYAAVGDRALCKQYSRPLRIIETKLCKTLTFCLVRGKVKGKKGGERKIFFVFSKRKKKTKRKSEREKHIRDP